MCGVCEGMCVVWAGCVVCWGGVHMGCVCVYGVLSGCVCSVCRRGMCVVMRGVYGVCLWVVRAETGRETQLGKGQGSVCVVCVWCVWACVQCVGCTGVWEGGARGQRQRDTVRQRTKCVDGYCT